MAAEKGKSGMKKRKYQMLRVHMSWKFCLCVVGVVLLCSCSRFQGSFDKISLSAWLCDSREELLQMGESASAYSVMAGFQDMEWFAVLLPLLASFGSVTDFAGQWFSGYIQIQNVPKSPKVPIHKGFFCFCNVLKIAFYNKITTFPHNLLIVSP